MSSRDKYLNHKSVTHEELSIRQNRALSGHDNQSPSNNECDQQRLGKKKKK